MVFKMRAREHGFLDFEYEIPPGWSNDTYCWNDKDKPHLHIDPSEAKLAIDNFCNGISKYATNTHQKTLLDSGKQIENIANGVKLEAYVGIRYDEKAAQADAENPDPRCGPSVETSDQRYIKYCNAAFYKILQFCKPHCHTLPFDALVNLFLIGRFKKSDKEGDYVFQGGVINHACMAWTMSKHG
jgi:hypothetical protein